MFDGRRWNWGWPAIIGIVVLVMFALQAIKVNKPRESITEPTAIYTSNGPLLSKQISIPLGEFHQTRLNLNRRARLVGSFRSGVVKKRVAAAVINEADLEAWKSGSDVKAFTRMGYVPAGKISVVLEPGAYLLLLDNRNGTEDQTIETDFQLE